jgi:HSP20 family protein
MALVKVKWNPWGELETLNQSLEQGFNRGLAPRNGNGNGDHTGWIPHMDVMEIDNAYVIEADLPGMAVADINVQVEANKLIIAGERKSEQDGRTSHFTHFERMYGKFQRAFTLPEGVDINAVEANYVNGVLTVNVPKSAEAQSKRIAVQSG